MFIFKQTLTINDLVVRFLLREDNNPDWKLIVFRRRLVTLALQEWSTDRWSKFGINRLPSFPELKWSECTRSPQTICLHFSQVLAELFVVLSRQTMELMQVCRCHIWPNWEWEWEWDLPSNIFFNCQSSDHSASQIESHFLILHCTFLRLLTKSIDFSLALTFMNHFIFAFTFQKIIMPFFDFFSVKYHWLGHSSFLTTTFTSSPRRVMVTARTKIKATGHLVQKTEWKHSDGRTRPIALPCPLTAFCRSVNKAVIDRRLRPRCYHLGSYFKRPKSSPVRSLACKAATSITAHSQ